MDKKAKEDGYLKFDFHYENSFYGEEEHMVSKLPYYDEVTDELDEIQIAFQNFLTQMTYSHKVLIVREDEEEAVLQFLEDYQADKGVL